MVRALVPYGGSSLMRAAGYAASANPYVRNAVRAARVIQYAYRHRRKIKKAYMGARQVVKYVSRKRKMAPNVRKLEPAPKRMALARADPFATGLQFLVLGQLQQEIVTFPPFTTANTIQGREGININVKGIKWCRAFQFNTDLVRVSPIVMHWAVVQPKQSTQLANDFITQILFRFFRHHNDLGDRDAPFVNNTTGSPWRQEKNCCSLNPDHTFNILFHKRKILQQRFPENSGFQWPHNRTMWNIEFYQKMNKSFAYNTTTQTDANHPLYELFWYETITPADYPSGLGAVGSYITTQKMHTVYFKDRR